MDNYEYRNLDLVKFIKTVVTGNDEDKHPKYDNLAYTALNDLMDKRVPLERFEELGWEFAGSDDDFAPWGYVYKGDYELFYQEMFIDEEEMKYTDDNVYGVVYFKIVTSGLELFPGITIGSKLTFDTVCDVFDGNLSATIRQGDIWENHSVIECLADNFMLSFYLIDGILQSMEYYAIGS